jgi:hypothetical protein
MLALQREKAAVAQQKKPKLISRSKVPFPQGFPAFIEATHEMIWGGSYMALRDVWHRYIKAKKLSIPDPIAYLDDAICTGIFRVRGNSNGYCASPILGTPSYQLIQKYQTDPRIPIGLRRGQHGKDAYHWAALHYASWDGILTPAFIDSYGRAISCGSCKSSWRTILRNLPPVYSPRDAAFSWSVAAHNLVNKKLSPPKPEIDVERAKIFWNLTG